MKRISHWKPRYLYNRAVRYYYERSIRSCPCLAIGAIHFLDNWLKKTDICLEYGAGQSTVWFAQLVGHIISIENNGFWYEKVRAGISACSNAEIYLFESKDNLVPGNHVCWDYVNKMNEFKPETFDFILNDGWARLYVGIRGLPLLKRGGIFVWDDWAIIFPTTTHIPGALPANAAVKDKLLLDFWDIVKDWRQVCFDDGVHSTAIFFKPF